MTPDKLPIQILKLLLGQIKKNLSRAGLTDSDITHKFWHNEKILDVFDESYKVFGFGALNWEEYGFIYEFYVKNKDKNINDDLYIPKPRTVGVTEYVSGYQYFKEFFYSEINVYSDNYDFIKNQINGDPDHYPTDGEYIRRDNYDVDFDDHGLEGFELFE